MYSIEVLEDAKKLLRKGWAKRSFATNALGQDVMDTHSTASCFCLMGAVRRAHYNRHGEVSPFNREVLETLRPAFPLAEGSKRDLFSVIATFNDEEARSVDDVIAKIDIAIGKLKENET